MKMNREILRLALPNIVSNITVPVMGIASTMIAGNLGGDATQAIGSLAVGIEGRNLWLMKSNVPHIDPETNIFGPSGVGSGVEYGAIPSTRSWGFNIRLTF